MTVALALHGCASATSAPSVDARSDITGSIVPIGYDLSAEEKSWDCMHFSEAIELALKQVARLQDSAKKEQTGPPPNLFRALGRILGEPSTGYPAHEELGKARGRVERYNVALSERGCARVNVDERLAQMKREAPAPATLSPPGLPPATHLPTEDRFGISSDLPI